jgi:coenzyme PQQ precursor peptide PqqA
MWNIRIRQIVLGTLKKEIIMWTTPAITKMRFDFEVTTYVMNK